jgi:HAD superfamily hydrolase (TIGR01509 family)
MNRIETVFFDMGGTLETLAYDEASRRVASGGLHAFLVEHNLHPACDVDAFHASVLRGLSTYRAWNSRSLEELPASRICSEFVLADFELPRARLHAIGDEFMLLLETTFYDRRERPEAKSALETLRRAGLKLGIISNVMSPACVDVNLSRYGLLGYFETVVASSAYGRRKPDPRIFLHAAEKAGTPPERCAHVGDKTSRDILGAACAGFGLTIRIEHPEVDGAEPDEPAADAVVKDLTEVIPVVERVNAMPAEPARPVRAILFDAGDILYYRPKRGERLARFLESCGLEVKPEPRDALKLVRDQAMTGRVSKREYLEHRLRTLGVEDAAHIERGVEVLQEEADSVAFFDGARETLHELKRRGYRLGIITDTYHAKETKLAWLRRNGIDHVWDVFVSSCEEGVRKPAPEIYHAALDRLGLRPVEAAFVGHKRSELDGARAVGMATVGFNHEETAEADHFVKRFSDLLALFPSVDGEERG